MPWNKYFGKMARIEKPSPFFLLLLLPLAVVTAFHALNVPNPPNDHAFFWSDAYGLYLSVKYQGLSALKNYPMAFHKPLLLGATGALALSVCGGSIKFAMLFHNSILAAIFLTYLYLLLRIYLSPLRAAAAGTFIGSLAWVLSLYGKFEAEVLYLPAVLAAFYHLLRSCGLANFRHGALHALWFAVAVLSRPVEALFFLGPPIAITLVQGVRERCLDRRVVAALGAALVVIFAWFHSSLNTMLYWVVPALSRSQPIGPFTHLESQFWERTLSVMLGVATAPIAAAAALFAATELPRLRFKAPNAKALVPALIWLWAIAGPITVLTSIGRVYSIHYFYFSFVLLFALSAIYVLSRQGRNAGAISAAALTVGIVLNFLVAAQYSFKALTLFKHQLWGMEVVRRTEGEAARIVKETAKLIATDTTEKLPLVGVVLSRHSNGEPTEIDVAEMFEVAAYSHGLPIWVQAVDELDSQVLRCFSYWLMGPKEEAGAFGAPAEYFRELGAIGKFSLFKTIRPLPYDRCTAPNEKFVRIRGELPH